MSKSEITEGVRRLTAHEKEVVFKEADQRKQFLKTLYISLVNPKKLVVLHRPRKPVVKSNNLTMKLLNYLTE